MFDPVAYAGVVLEVGRVVATPFSLLLVLSVVAWRYADSQAGEEREPDGDPAE